MKDLISSGQFAQLSRMTRKALRLYDELGLLRPVLVDAGSGYRYYSAQQLEDAARINTLRSLGMSLNSIQQATGDWQGRSFREQLEHHRGTLLDRMSDAERSLGLLDQLLAAPVQPYRVQLKTAEAQRCLVQRYVCLPEQACQLFDRTEEALRRILAAADLRPAGAAVASYPEPDAEDVCTEDVCTEDVWAVEVWLPFSGELLEALPTSVSVQTRAGGLAAATVHEGEYGDIHGMRGGYEAVWFWMLRQGYSPVSAPYETYLLDHHQAARPQDYRTEIAWMVQAVDTDRS